MSFDDQVKKAKEKQLQHRITRDIVFVLLGLTFLAISVFSSIMENKGKNSKNYKTTTSSVKK